MLMNATLRTQPTPRTNANPLVSRLLQYGISSFVYRARRPFHPQRIWDWMTANFTMQE
jgi:hypothetical protein